MSISLGSKKILIISPHPDDEVIGCGGLIAEAKRQECDVFVLYICTGACRQLVTGRTDEIIRSKELEDVANFGGFEYEILFNGENFVKLDVVPQKDIVDPIEDLIEKKKPDIICIPHGSSYNQDHRAVYTACITALRPIPRNIRHFVNTVLVYEEPYVWTVGEVFRPNIYIDTSLVENDKLTLMSLHKSQDRPSPFSRSTENLLNRMRIRGSEFGVKSAESYELIRGSIS